MAGYLQLILGTEYLKDKKGKVDCEKGVLLSVPQIRELYHSLNHYLRRDIETAVLNMFGRDITPFDNYWSSPEDFFFYFSIFQKMARKLPEDEFTIKLYDLKVPDSLLLNKKEREFLHDKDRYIHQARCVLRFLQTYPEYFAYEIKLISLGYPCEPNLGLKKA